MTLQEAKDQTRKKHYFVEWNEQMIDEVAELYARSKWDESFELAVEDAMKNAPGSYYPRTKPEFNP